MCRVTYLNLGAYICKLGHIVQVIIKCILGRVGF